MLFAVTLSVFVILNLDPVTQPSGAVALRKKKENLMGGGRKKEKKKNKPYKSSRVEYLMSVKTSYCFSFI